MGALELGAVMAASVAGGVAGDLDLAQLASHRKQRVSRCAVQAPVAREKTLRRVFVVVDLMGGGVSMQ